MVDLMEDDGHPCNEASCLVAFIFRRVDFDPSQVADKQSFRVQASVELLCTYESSSRLVVGGQEKALSDPRPRFDGADSHPVGVIHQGNSDEACDDVSVNRDFDKVKVVVAANFFLGKDWR